MAGEAPVAQRFAVVAVHVAGDAERDRSVGTAQGPAVLLRARKAQQQAVVVQQILRHLRRAATLQVVGRGHDQAAVIGQLAHDGGRIRQLGDADGEVDALLDQVDQHVGEVQAHLHLRVAFDELRDMGRDMEPSEHGWDRHLDGTARLRRDGIERAFRLLQLIEDGHAMLVIVRAILGQADMPGGAVEQAGAHVLFQPGDPVADHGRRQAHVPPGGRQAPQLHHPHENGQILGIGHCCRFLEDDFQ